ncbi:hypothetical protein H6P81_001233 [Aristolochia fimbriata]|uniref:Uncharacterized protein n=1 Tax=Aristolochia fimbriata TaxID=158543 RepID=A0AAV7F6B4_ARIFI|nr:hypothetical protein H6P81_001233 [Aristolochia fimbriata]
MHSGVHEPTRSRLPSPDTPSLLLPPSLPTLPPSRHTLSPPSSLPPDSPPSLPTLRTAQKNPHQLHQLHQLSRFLRLHESFVPPATHNPQNDPHHRLEQALDHHRGSGLHVPRYGGDNGGGLLVADVSVELKAAVGEKLQCGNLAKLAPQGPPTPPSRHSLPPPSSLPPDSPPSRHTLSPPSSLPPDSPPSLPTLRTAQKNPHQLHQLHQLSRFLRLHESFVPPATHNPQNDPHHRLEQALDHHRGSGLHVPRYGGDNGGGLLVADVSVELKAAVGEKLQCGNLAKLAPQGP